MTTSSAVTLGAAICKSVAAAVREQDAPLSAWPEQFPGRWATAARVAELLGRSTAQVNFHLQELVEAGELTIAHPWPGGPRGYQPAARWLEETPLFVLPEEPADERDWLLSELRRWPSLHGGLAPRQKDWSKENDPDRHWPRWDRVAEFFNGEALDKKIRRWVDERCAHDCGCSHGQHYSNGEGGTICDGCFDCLGHCPHGTVGHWVGPSGWRYALQLAGLDVRTGAA